MCTKNMELNHVIKELQTCTDDTVIFRKLINFASSRKESWNGEHLKQWEPVLAHIMKTFIPSMEITREKTLLASHTFFALLSIDPTLVVLKETFTNLLSFEANELHAFGEKYDIVESDLFKLTCAYGYLQVNRNNMYSNDVCLLIFDIISEHCIGYTKHSYFAYKILYMWLQRTADTNFWYACSEQERKLEAIIFSNWCNAINEISKQNSTLVFNTYLKIMEKKYSGYLEYLFKHCVETISWGNELKYDILAEICDVWNKTEIVKSRDFLLSLSMSLTKYCLRSSGTKVYLAIAKKLSETEWKEAFGHIICYLFHHWESSENENHVALQLLCKLWLEPVLKKYKNLLLYLWDFVADIQGHFLRSHLERMACEMRVNLPRQATIESYVNHKNEIVRLNGFAINCYQAADTYNENEDRFALIRSFLLYNANSTTIFMRDGTVKYFRIFYTTVLKMCASKREYIDDVYYITRWLHEFLLDCFEIGSCYQRKIFGLNLYKAILSFINEPVTSRSNNAEIVCCALLLDKHLIATGNWKFTDKRSLFILLRLVLDSALDVRQSAAFIILNYFDEDLLSDIEMQVLFRTAMRYCNSSKFYETESGAALMSILINWLPLHSFKDCTNYSNYSCFLLHEATCQLTEMKRGILKAIVQGKPFFGVMTALLNISFRNGPESSNPSTEFIEKMLQLLDDAVDFFLSTLSSKSESQEHSSSFAEMGLAIDQAIKNSELDNIDVDDLSLTPAHQVLVSCIWTSLKICCEMACEIGTSMSSDATVERTANIIVTVLLRCRHKGVVEAAGAAIGYLTRSLCKEPKYSDLPKRYLSRILENDSMHSLNITRRGAGLSIMFHRIVVSDNRRDRPLLHFAVQKLLDSLNHFSDDHARCIESQHDSPWARRLHFLRALVADKEIHAQLTPYMEDISLICFKYLESEMWSIRNASLQLFGSIVPRLVGQSSGEEVDFGNGYSINHFITHYPVLADYIMRELHRFSLTFMSFSTALYLHSRIVHVLVLLSKFSNSSSELIDYSSREYVLRARCLLRIVLGNPVWYVRYLAAKSYAALTDFLQIKSEIAGLRYDISSCRSTNLIHGYLLAIRFLKEKLSAETDCLNLYSDTASNNLIKSTELLRLREIFKVWKGTPNGGGNSKICYILETLFLQLRESISDEMSHEDIFIFNGTCLLSSQRIKPGFFQFIDISTKLYADYINRTNNIDVDTIRKILESPCIDQSVSFLNNVSHCLPILKIVLQRLFSYKYNHGLFLSAMTNYILQTLKQLSLHVSDLNIEIEILPSTKLENTQNVNLWSLKCVLTIMFSKNEATISETLSRVLDLSVHEEEHLRRIAVECMQFSVGRFRDLRSEDKSIVLHCCLILLKDEISDIREAIADSLRVHVLEAITPNYSSTEHDERIYENLLSAMMLEEFNFPTNKDRNLYFVKLFTHSVKNVDGSLLIENPFYHEDNPFYREESKFLTLCFYYAKQKKRSHTDKCSKRANAVGHERNTDDLSRIGARYQFQREFYFDDTNLEVILNTKYVDYLRNKQTIVIQEYS
ncbi:uncharacterized protein LOC108632148 [Ceratina calcarata]|uniref:Uncharacterized protein LOC108632148 n=1 Tax=Ceratina calcarata TaxID=156304 RepID=A0AAJ7NF24_9HYME|nr:uncharacterized protein LOC108632148 [Ceratina calcarata]